MTLLSGFDRIRIINLPSRLDRRREMADELRRIGLAHDPRISFVDGIIADEKHPFRALGEKGVFLAHLGILRDAAQAGESVLILEDDVDFTSAAIEWARDDLVDIAYGGYLAADPEHLELSDIVGAHCMGFSARAARALVPFLEALLEHESPPPIDGAYVWFRRQHEGFTTSFANPPIALQRSSRSDITPRHAIDKVSFLRAPVGALRRTKRKLQRGELNFGLAGILVILLLGVLIVSVAAYYYAHGRGISRHG